MYDIIVVGAGPVGLYFTKLNEKKRSVLVLEEDGEIGNKACSGLISNRLKEFVPIKNGWVDNKVKGSVLYSPSNKKVRLEKRTAAAFVINRDGFDKWLSKQIKSKVMFKTKVKSFKVGKNCVDVVTNKGRFKTKLLVGCDGANSLVRRSLKEKPHEVINGIVYLVDEKNKSDFVEMFFDDKKLKDGFFWKIPRGRTTEYGALGKNVNFSAVKNFFKIKGGKRMAAPIPIGFQKTYGNRVLLIGDAASQIKPWSGGGVIYGFTCSQIAKDVVDKAFKQNDFSENMLVEYDYSWKNKIGANIKLGLIFREMLKDMRNNDLDRAFEKMKNTKTFNEFDMDFPFMNLT